MVSLANSFFILGICRNVVFSMLTFDVWRCMYGGFFKMYGGFFKILNDMYNISIYVLLQQPMRLLDCFYFR